MRRLTIKETSMATGLSEYEIRMGIKLGKYPAINIGLGKIKKQYLIDIELFEKRLLELSQENITAIPQQAQYISPFESLRPLGYQI